MKIQLSVLVSSLALVLCACSGGSGGGGGKGAATFEVRITGAVDLEESGTSAMVYDMAGFTHVGMFTRGGDFQIDFNTKGTERPSVGVLELQSSNLGGWIGSVDITNDAGSHTYNATSGKLEITGIDGARYSGTFEFEATQDGDRSIKLDVAGSFEALER